MRILRDKWMERTYRPSTVGKQRRGTAHTCVHLCPSETPGSRLGQVKRENRKPLLRALNNVGGGICSLFMENSPQFYLMFQLQVTRGATSKRGFRAEGGEFQLFSYKRLCPQRPDTKCCGEWVSVALKAMPGWTTCRRGAVHRTQHLSCSWV